MIIVQKIKTIGELYGNAGNEFSACKGIAGVGSI